MDVVRTHLMFACQRIEPLRECGTVGSRFLALTVHRIEIGAAPYSQILSRVHNLLACAGSLRVPHVHHRRESGALLPWSVTNQHEVDRARSHQIPVGRIEGEASRMRVGGPLHDQIRMARVDLPCDGQLDTGVAHAIHEDLDVRSRHRLAQRLQVLPARPDTFEPLFLDSGCIVGAPQVGGMLAVAGVELDPRTKCACQIDGFEEQSAIRGTAVRDDEDRGELVHVSIPTAWRRSRQATASQEPGSSDIRGCAYSRLDKYVRYLRIATCIIATSMDAPFSELTPPSQDLQGLLDAAVDAIIIIDHLGAIHQFSRSAERLFGYRREEALGQNVSMLMPEPVGTAHDGYLRRYAATREAHIIGKGRQVDARRKDGSTFPVQLAVGVVPDSEPPRFVGIIHDITLQREEEEKAARLQERLTHVGRLATIGEMASGIAHELNQPLAAIATYAHACDRLLGLSDPDIAEVQGALREIAGQAVRAGDIIRRMRGLARADEPRRGPADINSVIAELTDLIEPDAKAHGIAYRLELAPNLPKIAIDRGQIQQVLLNLVRNALESI